jgi:hypothetical protein
MAGITNRPEREEAEHQERVERQKDKLPDFESVNRPRKDHPMDKDREQDIPSRGRIAETGVGQGIEHKGH